MQRAKAVDMEIRRMREGEVIGVQERVYSLQSTVYSFGRREERRKNLTQRR